MPTKPPLRVVLCTQRGHCAGSAPACEMRLSERCVVALETLTTATESIALPLACGLRPAA